MTTIKVTLWLDSELTPSDIASEMSLTELPREIVEIVKRHGTFVWDKVEFDAEVDDSVVPSS